MANQLPTSAPASSPGSVPAEDGTLLTLAPNGRRYLQAASKAPELKAAGWKIVSEVPSALVSGLMGAGQGVTLGHGDELAGAVGTAKQAFSKGYPSAEGVGDAYHQSRDAARNKLSAAEEGHPVAYGGGKLAGQLAAGAALPGGPIAAGALAGALQGEGESPELDKDAAVRAGQGAVMGGSVGAVLGKAIPAATEKMGEAAPRAFNMAHSITPAEMGAATPGQAAAKTGSALASNPELWKTGGDASLAEAGQGVMSRAGADMQRAQSAQAGHPTTAKDFHNEIESQFQRDVALDPRLRSHLDRVHRFARPDRYYQLLQDAQGAGMSHGMAERMATAALKHDKTPMSLREMQESGNSLKRMLDMYGENPNAKFSGDSPLSPEMVAKRAHSAIGEQVNQASGPEALAARQKYGQAAQLLGPVSERVRTRAEGLPLNPTSPLASAKALGAQVVGKTHLPQMLNAAPQVGAATSQGAGGAGAMAADDGDKAQTRAQLMAYAAKRAALQGKTGQKGAALDLVSRETSPAYRKLQRKAGEDADKVGKLGTTFAGPQSK